jgi:hypothetical protein
MNEAEGMSRQSNFKIPLSGMAIDRSMLVNKSLLLLQSRGQF